MFAMVRVRDRDQCRRPLAQRPPAQLGDTPLGDDLVDGVLQRRDDITPAKIARISLKLFGTKSIVRSRKTRPGHMRS